MTLQHARSKPWNPTSQGLTCTSTIRVHSVGRSPVPTPNGPQRPCRHHRQPIGPRSATRKVSSVLCSPVGHDGFPLLGKPGSAGQGVRRHRHGQFGGPRLEGPVMALTDGFGVDVAIEAVGMPARFTMAAVLVTPGANVANTASTVGPSTSRSTSCRSRTSTSRWVSATPTRW